MDLRVTAFPRAIFVVTAAFWLRGRILETSDPPTAGHG